MLSDLVFLFFYFIHISSFYFEVIFSDDMKSDSLSVHHYFFLPIRIKVCMWEKVKALYIGANFLKSTEMCPCVRDV